MTGQIILFMLAVINLIAISIMIYFKKDNWSLALAILEIVIVYFALTINA